ncbi:hypothetical protein [Mycolicibacterium gilvum]
MIHALRTVALTTAVVLTADLAIAYWFLVCGPFPENALDIFD